MVSEKDVQQETAEKVKAEAVEETEETAENAAQQEKSTEAEAVNWQQQAEEAEDKYLRLRAEFDNYRRRIQKENETLQKYRAQNVVTGILPALDNFERALNIETTNDESASLLKGMQMVHSSLLEALKAEGVEIIESTGQQFDPNLHQAVMQVSEEGYESNTVIEELQKGYKLKDRVIRPSMVKVNE
ncbi:nucleotide exchange factor GrpE [Jeotgalibacillus haloalkalitolerans]|uniref:Protein GrpE n=1 Tax=Jeotgalibacillus haloalkalitolerans TaxID=3104292 RepID=A0ABU5KLT3_9BACL|nr:nucleotide exchange factor GrpE [Jeotgalibacillus sp. HH7-29]MDZ5712222.1 nucleotide exchange factor GrpE [Jeotgalibacillus sp. HH7-29]